MLFLSAQFRRKYLVCDILRFYCHFMIFIAKNFFEASLSIFLKSNERCEDPHIGLGDIFFVFFFRKKT